MIQWTTGLFDPGNSDFRGEFDTGDVRRLPLELAMKYFTDDLFETFANETSIYSVTKLITNAFEIRKFFWDQ